MSEQMRLRSATPKPGYIFDGQSIVPASQNVVPIRDGLRNAVTGAGTNRDATIGYQYQSAFLTQYDIEQAVSGSGLMRKVISIPALDMVREWRDWRLEAEQVGKVEKEEKRHGIRRKIMQAETLRRMGGAALIMGLPGDASRPAPKPGKGALAYVHVVSRWHLRFDALEQDARLPGYGEPVMWKLTQATGGDIEIHPSRVIPFKADTTLAIASTTLDTADAYWGESEVAKVLEAVTSSDASRQAFTALLHKARVLRLGIPGLTNMLSMPGGQANVQARLQTLALAESMLNATVFDSGLDGKSGETITDAPYNFAGAKDIIGSLAEHVCAIADIPATRLLGRAPEGMNSSGESQQADWRKKVRALQTIELSPCIDQLDAYLIPSAIGTVPEGQWYDFAPLDTPTETEITARFKTSMEAIEKLGNLNAMPEAAFNKGVQSYMIEEAFLPGLEAALVEVPETERYGLQQQQELEAPLALGDAAPRTLYVSRKLLNAAEFIKWAKGQGFASTLDPDDLHVTVTYSRAALDWLAVDQDWSGNDGKVIVPPGGARIVEPLGDEGAVVLLFNSSELAWRHEDIKRAGASHDYPDYQPHVTISYDATGVDLANVEPYRGKLEFGPEIFEELDES